MVYAQLLGGIGNLSFIIATTYALALDNNDEATFSNGLSSITRRKNEDWWFKTLFRKIKKGKPTLRVKYNEPSFKYSKIPFYKNMQIHGYFQSPKYFNHRREEIIDLFTDYKKDILDALLLKMDLLPGKKISLHIRRADYLKLQHTHLVLPMKYYENAINLLKQRLGSEYEDYIFLVFSDDIEWCSKQSFFKSLPDVHFVEDSDYMTKGPVEVFQLYLMSMCDHNIIANSSFSWWGAYLNENPDKIVIAPDTWFNCPKTGGRGPSNWSDIYDDGWVKCSLK